LGDGWLASAYNTTPEVFGDAWGNLCGQLAKHGKDPGTFSNGLATMLFYITDDQREAERMLKERVVPTLARPEEMLRERLPIGSPEHFAEKLSAFARAGLQRVFIWPVADEQRQLELFWDKVRPLVVG
jgi:alkanesulfonate monooxygenase SsuD/methylene tetrahydromethanopterin reductase-like flavin-dependent oxidoreductase (luciferase family)